MRFRVWTTLTGYNSTSASGYSMIRMEFEYGIDMDDTLDEVNKAVDDVSLPDDATDPNVMHLKTGENSNHDHVHHRQRGSGEHQCPCR